ncbi:MAG: M28 family peptidase, partial [Nitrospirae bacterium]|nr:M28 family peptidase [Nitrospirota bacterium]
GERHPVTSPTHLQRAEEYIADTFEQLGLQASLHPFEAMGGTYRNVIASLLPTYQATGQGMLQAPLILAAHYDTVEGSPGADDNASAVAVLLETARRLRGVDRVREVHCIAFCLEEEGLLGSLAYAAELKAAKRTIAGAIVLECVGYASGEEGSQTVPPGTPFAVPTIGNFLAVVGNTTSAALTASVAQAATPHVPVVPLVIPGNGELLPDTRRSDHAAFWYYGFPAVMLTDTANFRNPNYHKSTDTLDTLNLRFLEQVADAVTASANDLAGR